MVKRRETVVDLDKFNDQRLDAEAKVINPHFCRWIGVSAGFNQRRYICRLCNWSSTANPPSTS
jgi:hypothetical protein